MRKAIWLVSAAAVALGCGGETQNDSKSHADGGAASAGGSGGSAATGAVSGSGGVVSTGGTSAGGTGGLAGASGFGGAGGYGELCCAIDSDCPDVQLDGVLECANGVCKPVPDPGLCWSDADCQGIPGACLGGFACPCAADCFQADQLGKCAIPDQCCSKNSDCVSAPPGMTECVGGNCEKVPPFGQCWTDADCPGGQACGGACVCPCGALCACGGQTGWCEGPKP